MALLDGLLADATTKDEFGLTQADRRQPMWAGLIKAGLLGIAGGENLMPQQRAQMIAQAGGAIADIPNDMMAYRSAAAQQALRGQEIKGKRAELDQAEKWRQYADSPEFKKAMDDAKLSEADRVAARAQALKGDFSSLQKTLDPSRYAQEALTRQKIASQSADLAQAEKWRQYANSPEFQKVLDNARNLTDADKAEAKAAAMKGDFATVRTILDPKRYMPKVDMNQGTIVHPNGDVDIVNPLTFQPEPYIRNGQIVSKGPQGPGATTTPTPTPPDIDAEIAQWSQYGPGGAPAPAATPTPTPTPTPGPTPTPAPTPAPTPTPTPTPAPGTPVKFNSEGNPVTPVPPLPPPKMEGRNEEYLKTLPPEVQREVRAIAEYDQKPYTIGQHSGIYNRRNRMIMDAVRTYTNGGYSDTDYSTMGPVKKEFSQAGQTGKNMTALDTLYGHIGDLHQAAQALATGNVTKLNEWAQAVRNQTGDPRVIDFNTARTAVADEMARAMKGSQISDTEIAHWKELFNAADAPEKIQAVITRAFHLIDEREKAIKAKYKIDTKGRDYGDFISPANKAKRDYILANPLVAKGANTAPQPGTGGGGGGGTPTPEEALEELRRRQQGKQ